MGRKTVAVGDLTGIWTKPPQDADFNQLKKEFAAFFHEEWSEAMTGANEPFSFHRDWNAYVAITGLREYRVDFAGETKRLRGDGYLIYNTIFG